MNTKALAGRSILLYSLLVLTGVAYYILAYCTTRENFIQLISLFSVLFACYFVACKYFSLTHFSFLLVAGILYRLIILFSSPSLSDDVYRFIWDGRLAANGINPFSHLPAEIIQMPVVTGITSELYAKLNSPNYFTVYPPVLQAVFWTAAKLFPTNVFGAILFFKFIIVLFELGNGILIIKLLKKLLLPEHLSLLYLLNPMVIAELTGNVHFEGLMIFFVLFSFLLLLQQQSLLSAICLGFGIATKLLPVLFLPLIVKKLGWKKGLTYSLVAAVTTLALFVFLFDLATIQNLLKSIHLFFQKFEFNASVYYLIRWIGTLIAGYNIISYAGPLLSLIASGIILILSAKGKQIADEAFFTTSLFIICVWFLCATTIHPWYISMPVALSVFTRFRFAIVWSFTAVLSYAAYQYNPVQEKLWLIAAGYLVVIFYAMWELKLKKLKAGDM